MQTLPGEPFCLPLRVGLTGLISMPSDHVPKRLNWAKWFDGISIAARVFTKKNLTAPKISISPDHADANDNMGILDILENKGLEQINILKLFSEITESTKIIFIGAWPEAMPSWFNSIQSIYNVTYSEIIPSLLADQLKHWIKLAESFDYNEDFLVSDDVGRFSSLTTLSRTWRSRVARSRLFHEANFTSWLAGSVEIFSRNSPSGSEIRLHQLGVLEPEKWCGVPKINFDLKTFVSNMTSNSEVWISSPGVGLSLWIAEQHAPLNKSRSSLRIPSSIIGWHPIRDALAFFASAPSQSYLYMVDRGARLHIIFKECETSK